MSLIHWLSKISMELAHEIHDLQVFFFLKQKDEFLLISWYTFRSFSILKLSYLINLRKR